MGMIHPMLWKSYKFVTHLFLKEWFFFPETKLKNGCHLKWLNTIFSRTFCLKFRGCKVIF